MAKTISKFPWFKFYPSDWRADPRLRIVSLAARGLWFEMICLMHEATPRGYLIFNRKPLTFDQLSSLVGASYDDTVKALAELEDAGVFSRNRSGWIYCRRMVRDTKKAETSRENGKKGGNPSLCKKSGISEQVNPQHKVQDNLQESRIQNLEQIGSVISIRGLTKS